MPQKMLIPQKQLTSDQDPPHAQKAQPSAHVTWIKISCRSHDEGGGDVL